MKTLICNCNRTMPLDVQALTKALTSTTAAAATASAPASSDAAASEVDASFTLLCRREAGAFQRAAKSGEPLLVACTQEQRLFLELAEQTAGAPKLDERPIHFVDIRETGGWSKDAKQATPKIAALIATARLEAPQPVATVTYKSAGRCLVVGAGDDAERAAALLGDLDVSILADGPGALVQRRDRAVHRGALVELHGWLGRFEAAWNSSNPIDPDLCTRCNACIEVCPEGAIDFAYAVDLSRCRSHRDCVAACEVAGAIDFQREPTTTRESFDLVLDVRTRPTVATFEQHAPPQGYVRVDLERADGAVQLHEAAATLRALVGEFEKPRFFHYKPKLCAHSRNERIGCTACIDVCSARAVRSDAKLKGKTFGKVRTVSHAAPTSGGQGGGIVVEPSLCVGCGACTTVCPSGALAYATPDTVDHGKRIRTALQTYARAGGRDAVLLVHSEGAGTRAVEALGRAARVDKAVRGVPARVIPWPVWHTASVGLDVWLAAIALGANQVWVLVTDEEAPQYLQALREQMAHAQAVLTALGYRGEHLRVIESGGDSALRDADGRSGMRALDAALQSPPAQGVSRAAVMAMQADKRATLEMALDHLVAVAPLASSLPDAVALPATGAPFGSLGIDTAKCTLCLSCVGACPESALADNPDKPQLRFVEKNCVQCGLCVSTCPEGALTLQPRLWLADAGKARKQMRVLHETEPFRCIQCGKPFGTLQAIEAMVTKLGAHPAFAGAAAKRLRMCGDCRVVDVYTNPHEVKITDL